MTSPPSTDHLSSWHVPIPSDLQGSLSPEAYALKDVTISGVTSVSSVDCNSAGDHEREGLGKASPKQSPAGSQPLVLALAFTQALNCGDKKESVFKVVNSPRSVVLEVKSVVRFLTVISLCLSLEGGVFIEKTVDITGIESPIRRKSLGGDQTKCAVKWR